MAKDKNQNTLADLIAKRERIALELVDIFDEMKPSEFADKEELSRFSSLARIAGERGKIGMKAIDKLDELIARHKQPKQKNEIASLTNAEIKLVMEFRKNGGKSKSASARSKA